MRFLPAVLALGLLLLSALSACRKRPAPPAPEPSPAATPTSGAERSSPAPAAPPSTTTTPSPAATTSLPQAKPGDSESQKLNSELTDAVARFRDKHRRLPASWQELIQTGFLKAMPSPPRGMRFAIDPISAMVVELPAK